MQIYYTLCYSRYVLIKEINIIWRLIVMFALNWRSRFRNRVRFMFLLLIDLLKETFLEFSNRKVKSSRFNTKVFFIPFL